MSIDCAMTTCETKPCALCYVCNKSLCREHFNSHDHSFNLTLNKFNDNIQVLDDRLDVLNNEEHIEHCYELINKWRDDSHKLIDQMCDRKCREVKERFHEKIDQQQNRINELNSRIKQILYEENISPTIIDSIKLDIENLENDLEKFEQTKFQIKTQPLSIEHNSIKIEETNVTHFNFTQMLLPYKTIRCNNHLSKPLSSNNQYLLIYHMKHLSLINHDLTTFKQTPWNYGRIWDISWSSTLNQFIIVAHYEIYLFDQNTMVIQRIQMNSRRNWWSCTCSITKLYLSTYEYGSSIIEFDLKSSAELFKDETSCITCDKDESIKNIIYHNNALAITIFNRKYLTKFIQLRSINQFDCIWSIQLDIQGQCYNTLRSCLLDNNQWLVADFDNQCLFHISDKGIIKTVYHYYTHPWYIHMFASNTLVISTQNSINFHKL